MSMSWRQRTARLSQAERLVMRQVRTVCGSPLEGVAVGDTTEPGGTKGGSGAEWPVGHGRWQPALAVALLLRNAPLQARVKRGTQGSSLLTGLRKQQMHPDLCATVRRKAVELVGLKVLGYSSCCGSFPASLGLFCIYI